MARSLDVEVHQRGSTVWVGAPEADAARVHVASRVIEELYELAGRGYPIETSDVQHAIRVLRNDPQAQLRVLMDEAILYNVDNRPIAPRSRGQRAYAELLRDRDVVFAVGPAGSGKTYLAMAVGVWALNRGMVKRLVLTRPAVEAGEKLGFLPGDLQEKVDPYLRPLHDALRDMIPRDRLVRMFERQTIEIAPLAYMRGRTLEDAWIVLDEAQNTTVEQMRMFLTRLGQRSRMVVTGDVTQIDLPLRTTSGLVHALKVVDGIVGIGVTHLQAVDIVRHPLVGEIVEAYARLDARPEPGSRGDAGRS